MDELLLKSAEIIENNFTKGMFFDSAGNYCMLGALDAASSSVQLHKKDWFDARDRLAIVVRKELEKFTTYIPIGVSNPIVLYNDNYCSGGVEAAKIFREAAEVEL